MRGSGGRVGAKGGARPASDLALRSEGPRELITKALEIFEEIGLERDAEEARAFLL
jgi:hypothetical protein